MLEFIILGQVPGTKLVVTFNDIMLLIFFIVIFSYLISYHRKIYFLIKKATQNLYIFFVLKLKKRVDPQLMAKHFVRKAEALLK